MKTAYKKKIMIGWTYHSFSPGYTTGELHTNLADTSIVFFSFSFFYSASFKDTLLNDIRKAREKYQGEELAKELSRIKLRIDNTEVLTQDIVMNLLFSYRDIQVHCCMAEFFSWIQ